MARDGRDRASLEPHVMKKLPFFELITDTATTDASTATYRMSLSQLDTAQAQAKAKVKDKKEAAEKKQA